MDLDCFFKLRTQFIKQHYIQCRKNFDEIKHLIEAELPPYIPPFFNPDFDDCAPPFIDEWLDANLSINVVGLSCLSMLSNSLKAFLAETERHFGYKLLTNNSKKKTFKKGFLNGYKTVLGDVLSTNWSDCPVNFDIIEQIILARNDVEHSGDITSFRPSHGKKAIKKHPDLFFKNDSASDVPWFKSDIVVTEEKLLGAIEEADKFISYICSLDSHDWRKGLNKNPPQ